MKTNKVKTVTLNVQTSYTHIMLLKNKKLSDAEIKTAIENAGYELGKKGIQRKSNS